VGLNSQGHKLKPLPSLFQLDAFTWEDSLVAVASRVVTAQPGDIESWDLTLYGEAFESLSCDPFSFKGRFLDHGLRVLHIICSAQEDLSFRLAGIATQKATSITPRCSGCR